MNLIPDFDTIAEALRKARHIFARDTAYNPENLAMVHLIQKAERELSTLRRLLRNHGS